MKKVKLYFNNNEKSIEVYKIIYNKLKDLGFTITNDNPDIAIAIGGDGAFLRMVKSCEFNSDVLYVGVNAGTLGFACDIEVEEIDEFINNIISNNYKLDMISIGESKIISKYEEYKSYYLNELTVREKNLNTAIFDVSIDNDYLEHFVGDGFLISTPFGSTAYNQSLGGSIVYNTMSSLQLTPIAPINNSKYKTFTNSIIIPNNNVISMIPIKDKNDLLIGLDGNNVVYDDIIGVETEIKDKKIKCIRKNNYKYFSKINDKFLK